MFSCFCPAFFWFSQGGLYGGSSSTLTGQQSRSRPKSLHTAGLHARLTRLVAFSVRCLLPRSSACIVLIVSCACVSRAGQINSRTMLLPLLQRFTSQMRVSLYHTPDLRGLLRLLVPQRFNETIGVQHIKVYLFDDSIIISGCVDSQTERLACQYVCFHTDFVCLSSNLNRPFSAPQSALTLI